MISKDFIIDTKLKKIIHNPKGSKKIYPVLDLYTYLQDEFDELSYMKFDIPIVAISKSTYHLTNGWKIDKKSLKYLNDGTLTQDKETTKPKKQK